MQDFRKKNNTWNIRCLVHDSFVPSTQLIILKIIGFQDSAVEAANKFSRSQSEEEFIIKDFSMKMAIKFQVSSILCYKVVHLQGNLDLKVCFDDCKQFFFFKLV